jgi:glutamine synthetase
MELMRQTAVKHGLSCLLHEKPFHGINGSGKHCNWSLATDTGINLLDPSDTPENNMHFLILVAAILMGVHKHAALLRASIGSAANDFRLGGHEAPPAIISVYLGKELESVLENIEEKGAHTRSSGKNSYDLNIPVTPDFNRDNTDRNRTSPFAFTGNKFEFRAVGSSANPAFPITVLNTIVAESLNHMLDEIEEHLGKEHHNKKNLVEAALPVVRKYLRASRHIRFAGDNYSEAWAKEAKKRQLPIIKKSIEAFEALKTEKTFKAFEGILTQQELHSRYDILCETYVHTVHIETNLMLEMFRTQILPAAIKQQKEWASSIVSQKEALGSTKDLKEQKSLLENFSKQIEKAINLSNELEKVRQAASEIEGLEKRGKAYCFDVLPIGEQLREAVDKLEQHIDDTLWTLPKYRELLFMI